MRQLLIWFDYKGDEIAYKDGKWISLGASGDGSLGDATFDSLEEMDSFWYGFWTA